MLSPQHAGYVAERNFGRRLGAGFPERTFAAGGGVAVGGYQEALLAFHEMLSGALLMAGYLKRMRLAAYGNAGGLAEGGRGAEQQQRK